MYKEIFSRFIQEVSHDKDCLELLEDLIEACSNYVASVNDLEAALLSARYRMEAEEYRKYIADLENNRTRAHNALIANVKIINRLCSMNKLEPMFKCNLSNREEVAEEAIKVVDDLFSNRRA